MRRLLYCDSAGWHDSVGFFVLRLVMGAAFMFHGWPKIQDPMHWMGAEAPVPGALQAAAAASEFVGGGALILGLLTRVAALMLAATMAVAAGMVHIPRGDAFVASKPGEASWELAAVYFACALLLLLAGPGRLSLDALIFNRADEQSRQHGV